LESESIPTPVRFDMAKFKQANQDVKASPTYPIQSSLQSPSRRSSIESPRKLSNSGDNLLDESDESLMDEILATV
jgi:hypothetical protein